MSKHRPVVVVVTKPGVGPQFLRRVTYDAGKTTPDYADAATWYGTNAACIAASNAAQNGPPGTVAEVMIDYGLDTQEVYAVRRNLAAGVSGLAKPLGF